MTAEELIQNNPQSISQALAELPSMTNSTTPQSMGGRSDAGSRKLSEPSATSAPIATSCCWTAVAWSPSNVAGNTDINLLPQGLVSNISVVDRRRLRGLWLRCGGRRHQLHPQHALRGFRWRRNCGASSHDGDGDSSRVALRMGCAVPRRQAAPDRLVRLARLKQAYKGESRFWADRFCAIVARCRASRPRTSSPTNPRRDAGLRRHAAQRVLWRRRSSPVR